MSQTCDLQVDEVMNYEPTPYPMSLFEAKNILCQMDKPQFVDAIRNYASSISDIAMTQTHHYVLDGGSLLHHLKWMERCTYSSIAGDYTSFTVKHYAKYTAVFGVYGAGPSINDCAH